MTNRLALILFLIIVACIAWDVILNDSRATVFLGKEMFEFLDWLAFWR